MNQAGEAGTEVERRLTELEIKASFADDALDQLHQVIYRQQQQIDRLMHEVQALRERPLDAGAQVFRSLRDELPPHY